MPRGSTRWLRLLYNLAVFIFGCLLPYIYLFAARPAARLFLLDCAVILGPWLAPRLLGACGVYLLAHSLLAARLRGMWLRLAAATLAVATVGAGFYAFFERQPTFAHLAAAALLGLLTRPVPADPGPGRLARRAPEIALATTGLLALALMARPPLALYRLWRPTEHISIVNVLYLDPRHELRLDLADDRARVVCLSGLGLACPPYDDEQGYVGYAYLDRLGYVVVQGTSDFVPTPVHEWLTHVAWEYGSRYNAALFRHADAATRDAPGRLD